VWGRLSRSSRPMRQRKITVRRSDLSSRTDGSNAMWATGMGGAMAFDAPIG